MPSNPEPGAQTGTASRRAPAAAARRRHGALIALNAGLAASLAAVIVMSRSAPGSDGSATGTDRGAVAAGLVDALLGAPATAQVNVNRTKGSYLLVGGNISATAENAVYVLDTVNSDLLAVRVNSSNTIEILGYRSMALDAEGGRVRR